MSRVPVQVVSGPLASHAAGFAAVLTADGYGLSSVRLRLWQMDHISRWLQEEGLTAADLTAVVASRFVAAHRAKGYSSWVSERSMELPLGYLRSISAAPAPLSGVGQDALGVLLADYSSYLARERGLAAATVRAYAATGQLFLSDRLGGVDVSGLTAADVTAFVGRECVRCEPSSARHMVIALRSLLRYLYVVGLVAVSLADAVPAVARRTGGLPRGLPAHDVAKLLASCDPRQAVRRRDHAILTLLVRLGLRAGEVAALGLDDVDWHRGELVVRGKGDRHERLPLPVDVGEAVAAYLQRGRPISVERNLFLRVRAPSGGLQSSSVRAVVHDACIRAGLPPVGAHRLRHTAATQMLAAGSSLPEIAQVLRHRRLETTAIYAKVDRVALISLARPWPRSPR